MHFDDRIATVLRQPAAGGALARIHFRQLLDLLGSRRIGADCEQLDAAYWRLGELSTAIPATERARILREPHLRLRESRLVAHLAHAEPSVAEAAIAAARLSDEQWVDLIPALPGQARACLRRRDDLAEAALTLLDRLGAHACALPPADLAAAAETAAAPERQPPPAPPPPTPQRVLTLATTPESPSPRAAEQGIGAIVRRIEAFHKSRRVADNDAAVDPPHVDMSGSIGRAALSTFDFTTDADGRIDWADADAAPMVVGLKLARDAFAAPSQPIELGAELAAAVRHRQPIHGAATQITGAPAITGEWRIDASPRFDPQGGRFTGYWGRMRRPLAAGEPAQPDTDPELDRMRQVLHELRTPVNAIQGFAEVIQQQLFGATPHEYRALAATIAGDSARILAGFEDLDRLVKLDSPAARVADGESDLAAIVTATIAQLDAYTQPRSSGFALAIDAPAIIVAMPQADAEHLTWRLLATLAGAAAPGEILDLNLRHQDGGARLTANLPASLRDRDENGILLTQSPQPYALAAGIFGAGFALRLAATEAKAARGSLDFDNDRLRLTLPGKLRQSVAGAEESPLCLTEAMIAQS